MPSIELTCPKTDTPFGEMFFPGVVAEILLSSGKYQSFEFILDSGADCTILPHFVASLTGNHLPKRADAHMTGVMGISQACYKGEVSLKIGTQEFQVRCLFTGSNKTPFLIGRIDFFSIFRILFDGNDCNIVLTRL